MSKLYYSRSKVVGELKDGVYRSRRHGRKHLLAVLDAWGVDKKIVDNLTVEGCEEIRVLDEDDNIVYAVSLETMVEKGIERNYGYGAQLFLPRKFWIKTPTKVT